MRLSVVLFSTFLAWSAYAAAPTKGEAVFRSNCAFCHGLAGEGGRGPNLATGRPTHGSTPDDIRKVISNGVPGTTMPSYRFEKDEMDAVVGHVMNLRQANRNGETEKVTGNVSQGQALYGRLGCANCHRIGEAGSIYGPELTRVGASRSHAYLRASIVEPSADVPPEWEGVTVTTKDGKRVNGVRINEDTFSVQLRDASQQFRSFRKDEVKEVVYPKGSLMPPYKQLKADELNDLLAYLDSLRGQAASSGLTDKGAAIK